MKNPSKKEVTDYYKNIQQNMTISPRKLYIAHQMRKLLGGMNYSVLDVGCGDCFNLMSIKCYSNDVTGCDLDTSWMKEKMPNLKFFDYDLTKVFEEKIDKPYDVITIFDVLEHIEEYYQGKIIERCIEMTKKFLVINTPIGKWDDQIIEREVDIPIIIDEINNNMHLYFAEHHEGRYLFMIWEKKTQMEDI